MFASHPCMFAWLGRIALGLHASCICACHAYCIVFGVGVNPNTGNEGRFVLKVTKRVSISGRRHTWLSMIELLALLAYMCIHVPLSCAIQLLGHHVSRCVIGGTRIEVYTPLSLCKDGESGLAHICWKYRAFSHSCLCYRKTRIQGQKMVGRPGFLAGRPPFWFTPQRVVGRCFPSQYLVGSLPRVEFQPLGALCKFLKSVANKGETRRRNGISRQGNSSMHTPFAIRKRAEAVHCI